MEKLEGLLNFSRNRRNFQPWAKKFLQFFTFFQYFLWTQTNFEKSWKCFMKNNVGFNLQEKWSKSVYGCLCKFWSPGTCCFHKNPDISATDRVRRKQMVPLNSPFLGYQYIRESRKCSLMRSNTFQVSMEWLRMQIILLQLGRYSTFWSDVKPKWIRHWNV